MSAYPVPAPTPATTGKPTDELVRLWWGYSQKVYGPDYPLYQALAAAVAQDPDIIEMISTCRASAHDPNMLLASIQYLVLDGVDHPLAAFYSDSVSPEGPPLDQAALLLSHFCTEHRDRIVSLMDTRHVQTNETGRCSGLAVGLAEAAAHLGQPINLVDDGASAGLNLALDEYYVDFGPAGGTGQPGSPVRLPCEIRGAPTFQAPVLPAIGRRVGIDREPVDITDEETARWMLACIWPGTGRQERARAAMRLRGGRPLSVRPGDMVGDLGPVLRDMRPGPTVVVTSWSYSYLTLDARPAFLEILREESRHQPLAWLCLDLLGVEPLFDPATVAPAGGPIPSVIGLALVEAGQVRNRPIGYIHSHGTWLHPLDEPYRSEA